MARPKAKAPARQYHISGQSVVRIAGRDIYLGKHDSPESIARYAVLVGIYQTNGLTLPEDFNPATLDERAAILLGQAAPGAVASHQAEQAFLVRHVTSAYRQHIATKYADSPAELHRLGQVCDELDKRDGDVLASDYGPLKLQSQRQRWIDEGKARVYCNRLTNVVIRVWKFAVAQELVAESCWRRLRAVEALRIGQTSAHEKDPIGPVDIAVVRATSKELTPVLKAMIRIQVATGMRPSELCRMKPHDIDRSGEVWVYRPAKHKNANKGKLKAVPLIGDAREAIIDYLARPADSYCFSPAESMAW
jgi:integrase